MARINQNAVKKDLQKALKSFQKEAMEEALKVFNKNKAELLQDFREHPVTKEIQAGPNASNTSSTLGGYGNLFSYIGFDKDSEDPTRIIEERLMKETEMSKTPTFKIKGDEVVFEFNVNTVDKESLVKDTPMPFEQGRSWVNGIEKGISGLSYYIYGKLLDKSRSGSGLQSDTQIRGLSYKPVKYMSEILNKFKRKFK